MVASSVGCEFTGDDIEQLECLQNVPVENYVNISAIECGYNSAQAVVDGTFSTRPFLPDHPKDLMKSGEYNSNVNVLLGCNRYV